VLALAAALLVSAASPSRAQEGGAIDRGRQLFSGAAGFAHGGPPCAACHDSAALARPGGGTMGPDLTGIADRIGPEGVSTALSTLYFPTMAPLFSTHPLTAEEQQALAAFLESAPGSLPRRWLPTVALGGAAVAGGVALLAITGLAGRSRIRSVRLAMLARGPVSPGGRS
jgi:mono/diheme cytochrome c family protein